MTTQKFGLGQLRHVLGDGYTERQTIGLYRLLDEHGLLDGKGQIDPQRLVGLAEFAVIMNRTPSAVQRWRDLPEPIVRLKAGPIYDRLAVDAFKLAHPELCGVTSDA